MCVRSAMHGVRAVVTVGALLGCGAPGAAPGEAPSSILAAVEPSASAVAPPSPAGYADLVARIDADRVRLASALAAAESPDERRAVLSRARRRFQRAVADELFPAWMGTPWAMNGTAQQPGADAIACGYFVATVLRDAGVSLHRVRFGQAAALRIQGATTPAGRDVHRIFSIPPAALAERIAKLGDGLYIIGLDVHVGFVHVRDGAVRFVHSSYTDDVVVDEALVNAVAIANSQPSGYFVSELMTTDDAVERWLRGVEAKLPPA